MVKIGILYFAVSIFLIVFSIASSRSYKNDDLAGRVAGLNQLDQREYEYWRAEISELGALEAASKFKNKYISSSPQDQHKFAHIFGEVLYKSLGLDGISACDESFAYGCYHSFIGNAIQHEGYGVVDVLNRDCFSNRTQTEGSRCQHGIGHGILAAKGYEFEQLKNSLVECLKIEKNDRIGGCLGGVFMEYNFQTMLAEQAKIRKYDPESGWNYPCNKLADNLKPSCHFWQGEWLLRELKGDISLKGDMIGEICGSLNNELSRSCYLGVGNAIPVYLNFSQNETINFCDGFGGMGRDYCLVQAASIFRVESSVSNFGAGICSKIKNSALRDNCEVL